MKVVSFRIMPNRGGWGIQNDSGVHGNYATKEAAFEAAAAVASNAIKEGHEINIQVPGSRGDEPTLGAA
jgi:hypothetical protein